MSKKNLCPHCGESIDRPLSKEEIAAKNLANEKAQEREKLIEEIKKKVVVEVIDTIQPLLDKMKTIAEEQQNQSAAGPVLTHEEQIRKLHAGTLEKLKFREQKVAHRLKKFQSRAGGK